MSGISPGSSSNQATATITLEIPPWSATIDYVYDPLNRLTEANYSNNVKAE